ncbi:MAG: pyruvate kinase [Patescibacteria group bacterium]
MFQTTKYTKIVCTLGPASSDIKTLEKMVLAGMNVARLNFSHGTYDQFKEIIRNVRTVSEKLKRPIAILQDLQGPKIRVADAPAEGIAVKKGDTITLTTQEIKADKKLIPVDYEKFHEDVKEGDLLLIDDGLIECEVEKIEGTEVVCTVMNNGLIKSRKGINAPMSDIQMSALTEKDRKDLDFGIAHEVDYVALSFVRTAEDMNELRKIITSHKSEAKIMAKIEQRQAVENLEEIIQASDAVMIARGDLGIEIPAENVPIVQKRAIVLCNHYGKPVITATHILNSMVENPRATRAEISDAANAVFDHSDALMLSNETAVGKYPIEAVETLAKVASATEGNIQKHFQNSYQRKKDVDRAISNATCLNAAELAMDIHAEYIVAVSTTGFTAEHIAKHRFYTPIITVTPYEKVKNQMALVWGCNEVFVKKVDFKNISEEIENLLKEKKIGKKGDEVVIVVNASKKQKIISTIILP